jgi:hypothetical protein
MAQLIIKTRQLAPVTMALAGFAAIGIGVYQGLVNVAPGYEGTALLKSYSLDI